MIKQTIAFSRTCFPELGPEGRHLTGDPLALISVLKVFVSIVGEQVGLGQVRMKEKVNMVLSFLFVLTFLRPLNRTEWVRKWGIKSQEFPLKLSLVCCWWFRSWTLLDKRCLIRNWVKI